MKTSESIKNIAAAFLKAQKEIGAAVKESENPFFKSTYADLGSVMEACKKALNDNGITVLQPVMGDIVETILLHESGEWFLSETKIVTGKLNDPQAQGSAITYARRYGLQSMVFIPAEDDDGNKATTRRVQITRTETEKVVSNKPVRPTQPVNGKCPLCKAIGSHAPTCPNKEI
jgi:hypothetical protein